MKAYRVDHAEKHYLLTDNRLKMRPGGPKIC